MMRKPAYILLFLLLSFVVKVGAQERKLYSVGFYNLENLFDTIHDNGKNDYEFLPEGRYRWGTLKYTNKIKNLATVLNDMSADSLSAGLVAVGVCEVENSRVLNDLVAHEALASRAWDYVHIEGADKRGIDCALLYNPELFKPVNSRLAPFLTEDNDTTYKTRGFLVVTGEMFGETVHFIVNHWPSRMAKAHTRERAGTLVRQLKDSLMADMPESKVIVMGDMNDNPGDKSLNESLGAVCERKKLKKATDLYNPWWDTLYKNGKGTLLYNGKWNLYDQIIVSGNMVGKGNSALKLYKTGVFSRDYMFQHEGRYKGNTKRTHAGGVWFNGYSDHLPVIIYLLKDRK